MRFSSPCLFRVVIAMALSLPTIPASAPSAGAAQPVLSSVTGLKRVARLTGENSINQTDSRWNVAGTDLGHMFDMDGTLYMVFGDTFGHGLVAPPGTGAAPDWRSNVMAIITDRQPADGLTFDAMITGPDGKAKELLTPQRYLGIVTDIPTNGIAVDGLMYLHFMAVSEWKEAGNWDLHHAGLAVSDNRGVSWTKLYWRWPGNTRFGQVAFARDGGYVYLFGIPGGRNGGVSLARVPETEMIQRASYRYYAGVSNGEPVWSSAEEDAALVVPAPAGELSVMWNDYLKRWTMMYQMGSNIIIREAPALTGPWSAAKTVVYSLFYPGLYAPFMHPWLTENGGETVYFTMSEWGPYNVSLMKVRLVRRSSAPTVDDAARALRIAGGLTSASSSDIQRLAKPGPGIGGTEAANLLRQALGVD